MKTADVMKLWQMQGLDAVPPSADAVHERSNRFARFVRRRNWIEYGAAVIVVVAFAIYAWTETNPIVRIGHLFIVGATFYAMWQLRHRASPGAPPVAPTLAQGVAHLRAEYARQRDALEHIWDWYLLPFVPGVLLVMIGPSVLPDASKAPSSPIFGLIAVVLIVLVFAGIWKGNRVAATRLQAAIDELDALQEEFE
jgi:hypothetical protein